MHMAHNQHQPEKMEEDTCSCTQTCPSSCALLDFSSLSAMEKTGTVCAFNLDERPDLSLSVYLCLLSLSVYLHLLHPTRL